MHFGAHPKWIFPNDKIFSFLGYGSRGTNKQRRKDVECAIEAKCSLLYRDAWTKGKSEKEGERRGKRRREACICSSIREAVYLLSFLFKRRTRLPCDILLSHLHPYPLPSFIPDVINIPVDTSSPAHADFLDGPLLVCKFLNVQRNRNEHFSTSCLRLLHSINVPLKSHGRCTPSLSTLSASRSRCIHSVIVPECFKKTIIFVRDA